MDPLNLILLIVVIIIGWRLRSVLGMRNDDEQPGSRADAYRLNRDAFGNQPSGPAARSDKQELPPEIEPEIGQETEPEIEREAEQAAVQDGDAVPTEGRGLAYLREVEPDFDEAQFLDGAGRAYEMILTAFAADDLSPVAAFLGAEVKQGFEAAIEARRSGAQKLDTRILRLDRPALEDARIEADMVYLDVRFRAEIISFTHAADVTPDEDNLPAPATAHDVWVFARPLNSSSPNWQLVATHGA